MNNDIYRKKMENLRKENQCNTQKTMKNPI